MFFLLGVRLGVALLSHFVTVPLTCGGTAGLLPKAAAPRATHARGGNAAPSSARGRPPFRLRFSESGCDVELICISLITNDIEHRFIPLLAVGIFPLEKRLFRLFPCLDWDLYVFHYGVVRARCIPRHRSLIRRMTCKYCFPFLGLSRNFLDTTS